MNNLLQRIQECARNHSDNSSLISLFKTMIHSLDKITLDNDYFLTFIEMFESIDDKTDVLYWDCDFSKCFCDLLLLTHSQLTVVTDFISYAEKALNHANRALCQEQLDRAKKDTTWLLKLESFYQDLKNYSVMELSSSEIIQPNLNSEFPDQEKYFINLLHKTKWHDIEQSDVFSFLEGYDFYYLSDAAYYLVLPACIKLCIDDFRQNSNYDSLDYISFFLKDKTRVKQAPPETHQLINHFIQLLSNQSYFLSLAENDLNMLIEIWNG